MTDPPAKLAPDDLADWIARRSLARYVVDAVGGVRCRWCGETCEPQNLCVSVHASEFGEECVGNGRVERVQLARCPSCEPYAPAELQTCVHVPMLATVWVEVN